MSDRFDLTSRAAAGHAHPTREPERPERHDRVAREQQHHAWLALGHAAAGKLELLTALALLEPDRRRLGERLALTLAGDDDAFADLTHDDRSAQLPPALRTRLRSRDVAEACERALRTAADDPAHRLLTPADPLWPRRLDHLDEPPVMLSLRGDPAALDRPSVSIVGARRASRRGLQIAHEFAAGLVEAGFAVVSGLAIGIDAAAHRGALSTAVPGSPATLAVLPTGPDRSYPPRNRALADRILEHGALLSEFPIGQSLERRHFPIRNRLVAALSYGTLIVEAAERSGTLTTANHVQAQNRELMVWPGTAGDAAFAGGEALLADGATAVRTLDDLLSAVLPALCNDLQATDGHVTDPDGADGAETAVCGGAAHAGAAHAGAAHAGAPRADADRTDRSGPLANAAGAHLLTMLDTEPADPDQLARRCGLPIDRVLGELTRLELGGLARRDAGGGYSRCLEAPLRATGGVATMPAEDDPDLTGLDASPRFELD